MVRFVTFNDATTRGKQISVNPQQVACITAHEGANARIELTNGTGYLVAARLADAINLLNGE